MSNFKKNSLIVFDPGFNDEEWDQKWKHAYPFNMHEVVVFLGEINEMPGHCIVAKKDGKVKWGYHTENFRKIKENEI